MRSTLLMSLALLISTGVQASDVSKIQISAQDAVQLNGINQWLNTNVSPDDCPGRTYFGLISKSEEAKLVGYEVIAECPDAPLPNVPLYFDPEQNYIERNQRY